MTTHRSNRAFVPAIGLALLIASCAREPQAELGPGLSPAEADAAQARVLAKEEAATRSSLLELQMAMTSAPDARLYRVVSMFDPAANAKAAGNPKIANFPILRQTTLTPAQQAALAKELSRRENYLPAGQEWTCIFDPGYVAEFGSGSPLAVICLKCGEVVFHLPNGVVRKHELNASGNRSIGKIMQRDLS